MSLESLLKAAVDSAASDLHLKVGAVPHVRVDGEFRALPGQSELTSEELVHIVSPLMNKRDRAEFETATQCTVAYSVPRLCRVRASIYRQRGTIAAALRLIAPVPSSLEDLHLPAAVERLSEERRGLVLVTGAAGSGKSTALAAMIDRINSTRSAHIITIEDPIEFLHHDKLGLVDQREVRVDTGDFCSALREALRQDPDVILVGEIRDAETLRAALVAAETGPLVLSALQAPDATECVHRAVALFPPQEQPQVRRMLASSLQGVISLRLLKRKDGPGRVPAVEALLASDSIRDCIVEPEKTRFIPQAVAAGGSQPGMQTFDQSLYSLYSRDLISLDDALCHASAPDDFGMRVAGISIESGTPPESVEVPALAN